MGCCITSECSAGESTMTCLNRYCRRRKIGPSMAVSTKKDKGQPLRTRSRASIAYLAAANGIKLELTEREIYTIVRSWKGVKQHITDTGALMFLRMFEASPVVKSVFEKFRTIDTPSDLWESSTLQTHGMVVMSAVDEIISNLDDPECVLEMVFEQGRAHARFGDQGLSTQLFRAIEEPFIMAVKDTLNGGGKQRFTPHIEHLYRTTIKFIVDALIWGFQAAVDEYKGRNKQAQEEN